MYSKLLFVLKTAIQICNIKNIHKKKSMAMEQKKTQEPVAISIRAKAHQRDLIDQAAERLGRSRSDFMLEASCREAENVLLEQTYFSLNAKNFTQLQTMLDNPLEPTERLNRLIKAKAPWE